MDSFSYPFAISALAEAIAAEISDDAQLALVAAVLVQLGDTLATIAAIRAVEQK